MVRFCDIVFSAAALLVLSPLLIVVILVLRFTGEGEVFYAQTRIGKGGRKFQLLKFATMLKNSPNIGTGTVTLANDPRILPIGRLLRKTKVNEIPQLLNVLRGDMGLIGPRPLTSQTFTMYPAAAQTKILTVSPGLSGIGSLVFRNEEKILTDSDDALNVYETIIAPYKAELECWFIDNVSLALYFQAIFATVIVVIFNNYCSVWRLMSSIPVPPQSLRRVLGHR